MLRVDCHFHPNFAFFLPACVRRWQARRLWKAFAKLHLDAVFISEHSYKHPVRSFETLERERPQGATTVLIPAVEALSAEGIDMIVFSRDTHVFRQRDILTPFGLPIDALVERVCRDPQLYGFIPHPYTPGRTGFLRFRGTEDLRRCERTLRFAEKYNGSLRSLESLFVRLRISHILRLFRLRIRRTLTCPEEAVPEGIVALGGSDAHHTWNVGGCLQVHIPHTPRSYDEVFDAITSPGHERSFQWGEPAIHLFLRVLLGGATSLREWLTKALHLYQVDATALT